MKKIYLPILATLLVFSSCQCNRNQSGTTTTSTPATASTVVVSGNPTTAMIPPSLVGGHVGDFIIQMKPTGNPPVCNRIHIFVYFPLSGAGSQQVTITSFAPNPTPMTFTDAPGNPDGAISVAAGSFGTPPAIIANTTGNQMAITVSARVNGLQYTSAPLQPLNGASDGSGLGTVTYSDGAGHQAVIMAEDEGIMQ